jgi:Xaa-Pro aminopeptidase
MYATPYESSASVLLFGRTVMSDTYFIITPDSVTMSVIRYLNSDTYFTGVSKLMVFEEDMLHATVTDFIQKQGFIHIGACDSVPFFGIHDIDRKYTNCTSDIATCMYTKSTHDIAQITKSASAAYACLQSLTHEQYIGKNGIDIARTVALFGARNNAGQSFPTSVAVGDVLLSTTVDLPTDQIISADTPFAVDMGFITEGYYSDITRMYFSESDNRKTVYEKLVSLHRDVIAHISSGITLGNIHDAYISRFSKVFSEYEFLHEDLGHSIGYKLHESPIFIQDNSDFILVENMIITLEPEIIVDGFHYRIEDMVLLQNNGCKILTE